MRLLWPGAIVAVVLAVGLLLEWGSRRQITREREMFKEWRTLAPEARMLAHTEYLEDKTTETHLFRSRVTAFGIGTALGGFLLFAWISDLVGDIERQSMANRDLSCQFLQASADAATREVRALQAERDDLADAIAATPTELEEIPAYFDAPFWFREFLTDLLDQQIAEANMQLGVHDTELSAARVRLDELRDVLTTVNCPS